MINSEEAKQLWELVKPLKTAMLVTSKDDLLQGRPMHLVQSEFDGDFYFFTEAPSEKTDEINQNHEVCLIFSCPKDQTYVSVSGQAILSRDQNLINQLWNPFVAAWFPQGKNDPSVALLKVQTYQAEYWQGKGNRVTQLYKYSKALITGTRPDVGEHETFS